MTRSGSAGCAWSTPVDGCSPRRACGRARTAWRSTPRARSSTAAAHRGGRAEPRGAHRTAAGRPAGPGRGPETDHHRRQPAARAGRRLRPGSGDHRAAVRFRPGHRLVQPGHRRQPRRLHPLRPLRAGLRRRAGQRRDRAFRQGLRHPDRLRPERPDGRQLVRDLWRVRAGLPHRGADQQADPGHPDPAARAAGRGGLGVPVLRRRLRADLLRRPRTRRDLLRRGPRPARVAEPAVREGPLRLGLRRLPAAADRAADPDRRGLPEGAPLGRRPWR